MKRMHPDLVEAFNIKQNRTDLFADWVKNGGDPIQTTIAHKRRVLKQQRASKLLRPRLKSELMTMPRFQGNEEWVDKVIADCVKAKRFQVDKHYPNDVSKRRYWVLDDESIEFTSVEELETVLEAESMEVAPAHAEQLTAPGGVFHPTGELSMPGFGSDQIAKERELMEMAVPPPKQRQPKATTPAKAAGAKNSGAPPQTTPSGSTESINVATYMI